MTAETLPLFDFPPTEPTTQLPETLPEVGESVPSGEIAEQNTLAENEGLRFPPKPDFPTFAPSGKLAALLAHVTAGGTLPAQKFDFGCHYVVDANDVALYVTCAHADLLSMSTRKWNISAERLAAEMAEKLERLNIVADWFASLPEETGYWK